MNKKLVIFVLILIGVIAYYSYQDDIEDNGRAYPSKTNLCRQFAQSYLRTISKTENITDYGSDIWQMAVDVETDLYELCLVDLNREALRNFRPSITGKYQDNK
ncbi:hypothetical protein HYS92_01055 [Candidatus Daviesbacteria bacterium]|nr:hypothetical protein [Candidatus Daviesbacteria bacterium]